MKLSPLPTTAISNQKSTETSAFPYPKFEQGRSLDKKQEAPVLSPFLETQGKQTSQNQQGNAEEQRMDELETMLSEAQSRTAVIEQEAYDKAYAAGEKSGLALGEKRAEQTLESMQGILDQAEEELNLLKAQSIESVLDIAQAVIEHVMGDYSDNLEQLLEKSVNQALDQFLVGYSGGLTLSVNPQDLTMFTRMAALPAESKIRAHEEVKVGTCRLVSVEQDILIDPKQAIRDGVKHIRERLLTNG